jgi:polygalacturonase
MRNNRRQFCAGVAILAASAHKSISAQTLVSLGLKGDGLSDDTAAIQRALNRRGTVFLPPGRFRVSNLQIHSDTRLVGTNGRSTLIQHPDAKYLLSINPGSLGSPDLSTNQRNIVLDRITFVGRSGAVGFSEHSHIINANACTGFSVTRCIFSEFSGDAIYIGSGNVAGIERHNQNVRIRECIFNGDTRHNRNAISVIDCTGLQIESCKFHNCSRPDMPGAIDLEPDEFPFHRLSDIVIRGNTLSGSSGGVGAISVILPLPRFNHVIGPIQIADNTINGMNTGNGITIKRFLEGRPQDKMAGIHILNNRVLNTRCPLLISGVNNVRVQDNCFVNSSAPIVVGNLDHGPADQINFLGNRFQGLSKGTASSILLVSGRDIAVSENRSYNSYDLSPTAGQAFEFNNSFAVTD